MSDAAHVTQQPNANEPTIHASRGPRVPALCGAPPGSPWTKQSAYVTCARCIAEIARRRAERAAR